MPVPDFNGRFSCHLTDFGGKHLVDRGFMDFTGHIDAQGNVRSAPHQYRDGATTANYTVDGSIKLVDGEWVLDLDRDDGRAKYRGFLVENDAARPRMSFVVKKFVFQPLAPTIGVKDREDAVQAVRLGQVEEPWIITKP